MIDPHDVEIIVDLERMRIKTPEVFAIDYSIHKNPIQQIGEAPLTRDGGIASFTRDRLSGFLFTSGGSGEEILLVSTKPRGLLPGHPRILQSDHLTPDGGDLSSGTWLRHPVRLNHETIDYPSEIRKVLDSWIDAFSFLPEDPAHGIIGLRNPQIGALHAVHAHWSVTAAPATIVMPTGTGKTETMLSVLVSARCARLLVIVPTDALRSQLARKFVSLGILKARHKNNCY